MKIVTLVGLSVLFVNVSLVQAAPPAVDKNPTPQTQMKQPTAKPPVTPSTPSARAGDIHIVYLTVHTPTCGQPLRFGTEIQNRATSERHIVGQVELQSEDGAQRVVQTFDQTLPARASVSISANLPFQTGACGAPHCYRARLNMDPDGPQWDRVEGRVCITSRCSRVNPLEIKGRLQGALLLAERA
jgi:hypothetical protein